MTRNVLVEDSNFDQGEDGFVFKAGRNRDAWRVGRPTENIEARNCRFKTTSSLIGVGSKLSGGVRNVYVHDCTVETACNLFYVKTNRRRGGFVENIRMENVQCGLASQVFAVDMGGRGRASTSTGPCFSRSASCAWRMCASAAYRTFPRA